MLLLISGDWLITDFPLASHPTYMYYNVLCSYVINHYDWNHRNRNIISLWKEYIFIYSPSYCQNHLYVFGVEFTRRLGEEVWHNSNASISTYTKAYPLPRYFTELTYKLYTCIAVLHEIGQNCNPLVSVNRSCLFQMERDYLASSIYISESPYLVWSLNWGTKKDRRLNIEDWTLVFSFVSVISQLYWLYSGYHAGEAGRTSLWTVSSLYHCSQQNYGLVSFVSICHNTLKVKPKWKALGVVAEWSKVLITVCWPLIVWCTALGTNQLRFISWVFHAIFSFVHFISLDTLGALRAFRKSFSL